MSFTLSAVNLVKKLNSRLPRSYDGTQITTRSINDLLCNALSKIDVNYHQRTDLVLAAWPDIIGPQLASMTQAISFSDGFLVVKVKNSTLHSLLSQHDKPRIVKLLRQRFPTVEIKNIVFRIG